MARTAEQAVKIPGGEVRVYPAAAGTNDASAMYVMDVLGVNVLVRARTDGTTYVHIDTDGNGEMLGRLAYEVCNGGENVCGPGDDEGDDEPDEEDGYVTLDRDRWWAGLGTWSAGPFPSIEIATYRLAEAMAATGDFPAAWCQGDHGPRSLDAEVRAYHDEGGDGMRPLEGVQYAPGELVDTGDWSMRVDRDYGQLGVMLYADGDPAVTQFVADRSEILRKYDQTG
jgi:hypothetical protein